MFARGFSIGSALLTFFLLFAFAPSVSDSRPVFSALHLRATIPFDHAAIRHYYHSPSRSPAAISYKVLYSFGGLPDAENPSARLILANGMLYGTSLYGGKYNKGAVFEVTLAGKEHVMYSFRDGNDGAYPQGNLTYLNGVFYGTTEAGGTFGNGGTVFSVSPTGAESVLYSFGKTTLDGFRPIGSLLAVNGLLYGTTSAGGGSTGCASGCGTVFSMTPSGAEHVLYRFLGGPDGTYPQGDLIASSGWLYGTTKSGGDYGSGSVFEISTSGQKWVLYSFEGNLYSDGVYPNPGLTFFDGQLPPFIIGPFESILAGTTFEGGGVSNNNCGAPEPTGCGTLFLITAYGEEFAATWSGGADNSAPMGDLVPIGKTLYGTLSNIGENTQSSSGAIFSSSFLSVPPYGTYQILHSFPSGTGDGERPEAGLVDVNGTLYGTTAGGGPAPCYCGTIFELKP